MLENTRPTLTAAHRMNLHEYQAKDVFEAYGIPVPPGRVAASADEAAAAAQALGGSVWVVKAQVHAGGRGKAGGVKVVRDLDAVRSAANGMLGTRLVTKQTGAEGLPVERVYVESGSDIEREIYLSLTLNRERGRIARDRLGGRRHGYRRGRRAHAGEDPHRQRRIRPRACSPISAASSRSGSGSRAGRSASCSRS